jgi:hypothetical protein
MGADTQRSANVIGARIFVDYQYVLAAACEGCRQTDNRGCLACVHATGSDGKNTQKILLQQAAESLCLVMDGLS